MPFRGRWETLWNVVCLSTKQRTKNPKKRKASRTRTFLWRRKHEAVIVIRHRCTIVNLLKFELFSGWQNVWRWFFSTLFVCYRGGRDGTVCWHGGMCHIWKSGWNCDETIDVINLYCTCATKPTRLSEENWEGIECIWTYYNLYSA